MGSVEAFLQYTMQNTESLLLTFEDGYSSANGRIDTDMLLVFRLPVYFTPV